MLSHCLWVSLLSIAFKYSQIMRDKFIILSFRFSYLLIHCNDWKYVCMLCNKGHLVSNTHIDLSFYTVYRCLILWLTYPCWALMAIWMAYLMPAGWANYRHYKVLHRHIIHITTALNGQLKACTVQHCITLYSMGKIDSRVKCHTENHLYMPLTMCSWFSVWQAIEALWSYI